jgi:pyridoxal phosphate enzyme (YggS family)
MTVCVIGRMCAGPWPGYTECMASIVENISRVGQQIAEAARACDRAPEAVTLLAVSKTQSAEIVREAWHAGQRHFGENYVQEALEKIAALPLPGLVWHFIGPLQSNKTRDIAAHFDWVHSVDRLKIATRLSEQRPADMAPLNVCIQVNISAEDSKSGVSLTEVQALCEAVQALPRLRLRGLMAIPAPCSDPLQQRAVYAPLAALLHQLQTRFPGMDTLSIGMSGDFAAAIAEGSTMVRVGTAIFGARH